MCSPLAFAAVGTGLSTGGGLFNANRTFGAQKAAAKDAAQQADENALRQYSQLQIRQEQEAARAAQAIQENIQRSRVAESTARVSAGENGVGGNSAAALLQDYERTASNYEGAVIRNKAFLDYNFKEQAKSVQLGAQSDINRAYSQIQRPNYLGILLQGAGDFLALKGKADALNPLDTADVTSGSLSPYTPFSAATPPTGMDFTPFSSANQGNPFVDYAPPRQGVS